MLDSKHKMKLIITILLALLIISPATVSAQSDEVLQTTNSENTATTRSSSLTTRSASAARTELEKVRRLTTTERQQKIDELKSKAAQERCTIVTANIDRRLTFYDENHEFQVARFQQIRTRVNLALTRLENLGLNVSDLRVDYTALGTLIVELNQIRTNLITKLGEAKDSVCGQTDSAFKIKVQEAETLVTQLRGKAREIRIFIQTDLKESLLAVKQQASSSNN